MPSSVESSILLCLLVGFQIFSQKQKQSLFLKHLMLLDPVSSGLLVCLLFHRLFHRILANLISSANDYSFQFGFRDFDGTGACASLTDFLIKYARRHCKSLHMAFVDLWKAFDSVDHEYLWKACAEKGLPSSFLEYIIRFYNSTGTFLISKGRSLAHSSLGEESGRVIRYLPLFSILLSSPF